MRQPAFLESLDSVDGKLVRIKPFYKTSVVVVVVVVVVGGGSGLAIFR